ncbi:hypothetical protein [Paracidovorax valerianellae]|uniref:Uncharacterized protein n=1 Tax=Paracidovorax valerianellae TaxID=187868 RepID=A0A1G7F7P9_9BURK|nr:hypothetical protein [Paracidovorax valerianellae]MDA8443642.1 hypothetical protein [Paracidovorax valerianellae]SDE71836.1 hypothetical protein SAMN05192589_12719 [Paracidovorax valerianellae]
MQQQDLLRSACAALGMTQKELADRMATSWETFRKWLMPPDSGSYREMPHTAWQLVCEILAHERLKTSVMKSLVKVPNGHYNQGLIERVLNMNNDDQSGQFGDTQEFTLETKAGRFFQAGIQLVGRGIYTPMLSRQPKESKSYASAFYDTLAIRGGTGLDGQLLELVERANARITANGQDPIAKLHVHSGPVLLSKDQIQTLVGPDVSVEQLAESIELKVSRHSSGRLTLMRKDEGMTMFRDCDGPLFANVDHAAFYRAVAHTLHALHSDGHKVSYADTLAN